MLQYLGWLSGSQAPAWEREKLFDVRLTHTLRKPRKRELIRGHLYNLSEGRNLKITHVRYHLLSLHTTVARAHKIIRSRRVWLTDYRFLPLIEAIYKAREKYRAVNEFTPWIRENRERFYSLVQDLITLKNPAFGEEQEARAIRCVERGKVLTRVSGQVVVPYIEANFWEDDEALSDMDVVIPEIWLGPKSNDLNRKGISSLGMWLAKRYDCGHI